MWVWVKGLVPWFLHPKMLDDVDNNASPYSNDRIGIELSPDLQSIKAMGSMIQASIVYIDIDIYIYIDI